MPRCWLLPSWDDIDQGIFSVGGKNESGQIDVALQYPGVRLFLKRAWLSEVHGSRHVRSSFCM